MTFEEFLKHLSEIQGWSFEEGERQLRLGGTDLANPRGPLGSCQCPITAVANKLGGHNQYAIEAYYLDDWEEAAKSIGLDYSLANKIVNAADDNGDMEDQELNVLETVRTNLLRATGLEEPS